MINFKALTLATLSALTFSVPAHAVVFTAPDGSDVKVNNSGNALHEQARQLQQQPNILDVLQWANQIAPNDNSVGPASSYGCINGSHICGTIQGELGNQYIEHNGNFYNYGYQR